MTATNDYWLVRLSDAVEGARAAQSQRSLSAYLRLARHCCMMHELTAAPDRRFAKLPDPVLAAARSNRNHDFHSIHDALMEAA